MSSSIGRAYTELRKHWEDSAKTDPDYRTGEEKRILIEMHRNHEALQRLGWSDAIYCPKDGTHFLGIEAGSAGVAVYFYEGKWPNGRWWGLYAGDQWPARPILLKPLPPEQKRKVRRE